jgi:hypothetical protein
MKNPDYYDIVGTFDISKSKDKDIEKIEKK